MENPTPESPNPKPDSIPVYWSDSETDEEEELRYLEQINKSKGFDIESSYGSHLCGGIVKLSLSENADELGRLALFAVDEHNKKENAHLEFVKANMGFVAGCMYYITLEAMEAGMKKKYQAKVWDGIEETTLEMFRLADDVEA